MKEDTRRHHDDSGKKHSAYGETDSYLSTKIKDADSKKYFLNKELYEINYLSYETGSREGDYKIRDKLDDLRHDVEKYNHIIRFFENGKKGDLKAYEDILVFFENSFLDYFIIEDKIRLLKEEIVRYESENREINTKYSERKLEKEKNAHIIELKEKLRSYEEKVRHDIAPRLRNFLSDINHILFCEKIKDLIKKSIGSDDSSALERKMRDIHNFLFTFLWIHHKIQTHKFLKIELKDFIINTIQHMGFEAPLFSMAGIGRPKIMEIIDEVINEFISVPWLDGEAGYNRDGAPSADAPEEKETPSVQLAPLKALLDDLSSVALFQIPSQFQEYQHARGLNKNRNERYLFYIPGSFSISLKGVADYLINSLIFIYSWLLIDLKRKKILSKHISPLMDSISSSENFVRAYNTALSVSSFETNQTASFIEGEIRQYISKKLAATLIDSINENCDVLNEAFIACNLNISGDQFKDSDVIMKKMKIIQDFFNDARIKIMNGLKII